MDMKIKRGQILKELRVQKGLKQSELANLLGITQQAYQRYEYGTSEPNADGFAFLADFYGVTSDYLLGREPEQEPQIDYDACKAEADAVIDQIANLNPEEQAVMLDILHKLSDAARARRASNQQTITVQTAARTAPGEESEPIHEEQMTLEEFERKKSFPKADEDM